MLRSGRERKWASRSEIKREEAQSKANTHTEPKKKKKKAHLLPSLMSLIQPGLIVSWDGKFLE